MRFYWDGSLSPQASATVEEAIDLAEARSACTCEVCSAEGRLYGPRWLTTRCEAHAQGRSVEIKPGLDSARDAAGAGSGNDPRLDPAYRNDLTSLMSPSPDDGRGSLRPPDLWIYGHTHESFDAVIGATRAVSNAKGYEPWLPLQRAWDNPRFDPNFMIEI
ncbi:hypothetical protein [Bradyrhizobium diazoefficiens]